MSQNVFADIGMPNPDTEFIKAQIVYQISQLIQAKGLTQREIAEQLGIDQPKVSALLRGQWEGYSIERLIRFVNRLHRDVTIVIGDKDTTDREAKTQVITG
ncbi:MAG TPA: helix-turn-helix transcriptional regulator [Chthonomonadaceae bacterium]|nr:helix-turn-helix transcriptional regulator [Chthonomonadaceae bacterium]